MTYAGRIEAALAFPVRDLADDEGALVRRAQARDVDAFERLYRTHVGRVHAICLRMLADPREAEELTERAWIMVWEKLPHFRGESAFASWLHRLAVNTVLATLRADKRRHQRVFATDDLAALETPVTPPPPGTLLDLDEAISALPPQARIVFVLHDVEGWQHDEIANRLGVATGTTKAQLHRARKLLQEALQ
jgi:RNA polymerase sigma-70 factor (ECF subfamily)